MTGEFITNINRFRASARHYADLSQCEDSVVSEQYHAEDFIDEKVPGGFVYAGGLVIEDWTHNPRTLDGKKYYLCIGNQEWLSDDLAYLENQLFDWYLTECCD